MDKAFVQDIIASGSAMLTSMAQAAKTTGEHLYGVLVKQQMVEGISSLASFLLLIPFFFYAKSIWIAGQKEIKKGKESNSYFDESNIYIPVVFFIALSFMILLLITSQFETAIQKIINPEYFAIKFLIDSVKAGGR